MCEIDIKVAMIDGGKARSSGLDGCNNRFEPYNYGKGKDRVKGKDKGKGKGKSKGKEAKGLTTPAEGSAQVWLRPYSVGGRGLHGCR